MPAASSRGSPSPSRPPQAVPISPVLALGGLAALVGIGVLVARRDLPERALGLVVLLATALIAVATSEGGSLATGTADNEMLFVWVCLYSFYFFALPHALAQLAAVGLAYGWLLAEQGVALDDGATRWLVTIGTLLLAGLLVARLRGSLEALVSELGERARLDSLTGLLNRRALDERAAIEFARARREGTEVGVLVADIDGFKALNDDLGHPAGDVVLLQVACVLDDETREADAVARLGGDEFVVLLPGVNAAAALTAAERLRDAVESETKAQAAITISIGVAIGGGGDQLDPIWQAADRAMYDAKRAGGNQVALAIDREQVRTRIGNGGMEY